MKVVFRVDASAKIGTGHVMRCLTLADALVDNGVEVHFICRHLPDSLEQKVRDKGFELSILPSAKKINDELPLAHSDWLEVTQETDAQATLTLIESTGYDWLIIDHYALDIRWEKVLRPVVKKIMVIDDLADRNHDCDILLDQNLYIDQEVRYKSKVSTLCKKLIGPRYALLRNEFISARKNVQVRQGDVKRILVFFGGVDADDFTSKTILALSETIKDKIHIDVVIGDQHPNKLHVKSLCEQFGYSCHIQTNQIAELMSSADFSIGAGGGAVWERACLMLPTLSIPIASHQVKQLIDVALNGIIYVFDSNNYNIENIKTHINALIHNSSLRTLMSAMSAKLVDGKGAYRVVQAIRSDIEINIRKAVISDQKALFGWRNHPKIREVSFNKKEITWEQHTNWFSDSIVNTKRLLLIGEYNNKPLGVVRFDLESDNAEVSIYLVQDENNNGLGLPLIKAAEKWLFKHYDEIKILKANVLESNIASQEFFIKAGYNPDTRVYFKER